MQNGKVSVLSLETIWCTVEAKKGGVTYNPSADPVFGACVPTPASPGPSDWHGAVWEPCQDTNLVSIGTQVGPGAIQLTAGVTYSLFVKWTDAPDAPVEMSGTFKAY